MNKKIGLLLAALVMLPGCTRIPSYKPKSLKSLDSSFTYTKVENNVVVRANRLNEASKSYLFSDRHMLLNNEDIEIVHFSIHNLTADPYTISPDSINIAQVKYHDVLRSLKTGSGKILKRSVLATGGFYGASSGLTAIICSIMAIFSTDPKSPMILSYFAFYSSVFLWPVVAGMILLPLLGKSIKSAVMNGRIRKDLQEKMLQKNVVIQSGEKYEGLIFVKSSNYTPRFSLVMNNATDNNNKITFDVDLNHR